MRSRYQQGSSEAFSPWIVGNRLLTLSLHAPPSVPISVLISSSFKDIGYIGLGPSLITSF